MTIQQLDVRYIYNISGYVQLHALDNKKIFRSIFSLFRNASSVLMSHILTTYNVSLSLQLHKIVNALNDDEPLVDSILLHMGNIYAKLEKFELSISFYRRSLRIMERKYGNESCVVILNSKFIFLFNVK